MPMPGTCWAWWNCKPAGTMGRWRRLSGRSAAAVVCLLQQPGLSARIAGPAARGRDRVSRIVTPGSRLPATHTQLSMALRRQGQLDEAQASLAEALRLDGNHTEAHLNLGVIHRLRGELDQAEACYEAALRIEPEHAATQLSRAILWLLPGRLFPRLAGLRMAMAGRHRPATSAV